MKTFYIYDNSSLNASQNEKHSGKRFRGIKTHILYSIFF